MRNVAEEAQQQAQQEEPVEKKKRERRSKQARAARQEREAAFAAPVEEKKGLAALGVPAWLGISAACLVLGCVLGRFVLGGGSAKSTINGAATVSEAQLDDAFATYTYNGKQTAISIREVMEQVGSVESMKDEEGNYKLPTAEYAINAARNAILLQEAESRGLKVTEKDLTAYAETNLGTSDFDALATNYGLDADTVKKIINESCLLNALREDVIGGELPAQPEAPATPEEGKEDEATKEYADYIINLAGDEWNAKKGKWADKDGTYATALKDADFSADGATYEAATTAYYVAYQLFSEQQTEMTSKWTDFTNGLLSNASIEVNTLVQ